jgi:hypothetical protein
MKNLSVVAMLAFGSLVVVACDKGGSQGAPAASGSAAPMGTPGTTSAAATTAATPTAAGAAANLALSGTCVTKAGARVLGCAEYYGKLPDGVADSCKKDEGTFTSGATPCSTANAIGKCAHKGTSAANEVDVAYKTSVGDAKGSCDALGNTWTALSGK